MTPNDSLVVDARNVTVEFRTPHYKASTFKEYVFNKLQGRGGSRIFRALSDVSVNVKSGESVALIGHNGSGKSTLLKVIAGIIDPPGANVKVNGRIAPMIELSAGFDGELSGRENIVLSCTLMGLSMAEIDERMEGIIDFAELRDFIEMPFKNYSSGMQARLGFACATAVDPDIILADEVLAVGDSNFARKCLNRIAELKALGASVLLVSHDASAVRLFCDRAYVFDEGRVVYEGDVHAALGVHEETMEKRYLKGEEARKKPTSRHKSELGSRSGPAVGIGYTLKHRHAEAPLQVTELDVAKAFEIVLEVETRGDEKFEGDAAVAFCLVSIDGVRVCGYETPFLLTRPISMTNERSQRDVSFSFLNGIPELAAGSYRLMASLRDSYGKRLLFLQEIGEIKVTNSAGGENQEGDLLVLSGRVSVRQIGRQPQTR